MQNAIQQIARKSIATFVRLGESKTSCSFPYARKSKRYNCRRSGSKANFFHSNSLTACAKQLKATQSVRQAIVSL